MAWRSTQGEATEKAVVAIRHKRPKIRVRLCRET